MSEPNSPELQSMVDQANRGSEEAKVLLKDVSVELVVLFTAITALLAVSAAA